MPETLFRAEVTRVADLARRGTSVRIVGKRGSGRSGILRRVARDLDRMGSSVRVANANPSLASQPFGVLDALGFELSRGARTSVSAYTAAVGEALSAETSPVFAIDDLEHADPASLGVIDSVARRIPVVLVAVTPTPRPGDRAMLSPSTWWPLDRIVVPSLGYDGISDLLTDRLGAEVEPEIVARVLTVSSGSPWLAVAVVDTAVDAGAIRRTDGHFSLVGDTLWSERLSDVVEELLVGLSPTEADVLLSLSLSGAQPAARVFAHADRSAVESLEERGLLKLRGSHDALWYSVEPPLLADYFRGRPTTAARLRIVATLAESHGVDLREIYPSADESTGSESTGAGSTATGSTRARSTGGESREFRSGDSAEDAAIAGFLREQVITDARTAFMAWLDEPSIATANRYLEAVWEHPIEGSRATRIFAETVDSEEASAIERLVFRYNLAQWTAYADGDVDRAVQVLEQAAHDLPEWGAEAKALGMMIAADLRGVPVGAVEELRDAVSRHPESGAVTSVRAMMQVLVGDPLGALETLDGAVAAGRAESAGLVVRGYALVFAGRLDEALELAEIGRERARRVFDRFTLCGLGYVSMLAFLQRGDWERAERVMSSVYLLGRPGFRIASVYLAVLRLGGITAALTGRPVLASAILEEAREKSRSGGPLPGMDGAWAEVLALGAAGADGDEDAAIEHIERTRACGWAAAADYGALFSLCRAPSERLLEAARAGTPAMLAPHAALLEMAGAVVHGGSDDPADLLPTLDLGDDAYAIGILLGSALVAAERSDDAEAAAGLLRAQTELHARRPELARPTARPGAVGQTALTSRENDVALLAGSLSNAEIGRRLGISSRTVENHIANALRKTGTGTRRELFRRVRAGS